MQYCSLQHQTLLPSPVTYTTGCCFRYDSVSSFFLELSLLSSPVVYRAPTNLGSSSFSVLSFCLFILLMGFSRQEYWSGLPFPSPVDHVLSDLSIMMCPSWVPLHGTAYSFTELGKAVAPVTRFVSFLWLLSGNLQTNLHSVCLMMEKDERLVEASWWERLTEGETGSCFLSGAMLSKSLIQFSVDEWGCFHLLLFTWANCGGGNEENGVFIQKVPCRHCYTSAPALQHASTHPWVHQRLLDIQGQVWVSILWGHCSFLLGLGEHKVLFVPSKSLFPSSV